MTSPVPEPAFLTLVGAGRRLGLSARTVRRYIDAGLLPARLVNEHPRVRSVDLARFVERAPRVAPRGTP
jgi:hypothetical protein